METDKTNYNYHNWGECIDRFRRSLGIRIIDLCIDCNFSTRTYYQVLSGMISTSAITSVSWTTCTSSS